MQTNGNWQAYFIITDPSPFEARLQEILASNNDPRLSYFQVDMRYRPAVRDGFCNVMHWIVA
jgi:hypothetical protein